MSGEGTGVSEDETENEHGGMIASREGRRESKREGGECAGDGARSGRYLLAAFVWGTRGAGEVDETGDIPPWRAHG